MTQPDDDTHDDEIYDALLDMTSGLDGGMSAAVFRRELAKQGLEIVSVEERDRLAAENARLREALEASMIARAALESRS